MGESGGTVATGGNDVCVETAAGMGGAGTRGCEASTTCAVGESGDPVATGGSGV